MDGPCEGVGTQARRFVQGADQRELPHQVPPDLRHEPATQQRRSARAHDQREQQDQAEVGKEEQVLSAQPHG